MGFPLELVERNSEIDTTVGAVCDRAQSLSFGKMRGHRPCLQKLWYQIRCYAPLEKCRCIAQSRPIPAPDPSHFPEPMIPILMPDCAGNTEAEAQLSVLAQTAE